MYSTSPASTMSKYFQHATSIEKENLISGPSTVNTCTDVSSTFLRNLHLSVRMRLFSNRRKKITAKSLGRAGNNTLEALSQRLNSANMYRVLCRITSLESTWAESKWSWSNSRGMAKTVCCLASLCYRMSPQMLPSPKSFRAAVQVV
jgi:hypothetical protein